MLRLGVGVRAVFGQRGKDLLLLYSRAKPLGATDVLWGGFLGRFGIVHAAKQKERKKERKKKRSG